MCTVTFIPVNKSVFITHSRDEYNSRSKALPPERSVMYGTAMIFPKDGKAGGSWAGLNEFGHAAVLLNGAFKKHIPSPPYRKSRGLIFLELLSSPDLHLRFQSMNLHKIEPFTVIYWNGAVLYELRWDAERKYNVQLDAATPHMWSSATLYDDDIMHRRTSWLNEWRKKHPAPGIKDIMQFHLTGGEGDQSNDLRMNRNGEMSTLSITAMKLSRQSGMMKYLDLADNNSSEIGLTFRQTRVTSQ
jgi:uncharacterized protein with NRDE domain